MHFIHVRLNGNHIPGSPFRVLVGRQDADAGLVRAYGDGLSRGMTGMSAFRKSLIPVCVLLRVCRVTTPYTLNILLAVISG